MHTSVDKMFLPKKHYRLCLLEDHIEYREALLEALKSTEEFQIQGVFSNAEDTLEHLQTAEAPDVLIIDLGLPGMDGLDAIRDISTLAPDTKILVLTVFDNKQKVFQALGAGASGYLTKADGLGAIMKGIEDICHGISPLSAEIATMVFNTFSRVKPVSSENDLSERERKVLVELSKGYSRKQIAEELCISIHTVNTHIRTIYHKLQVHNVSGAILKASTAGVL